MDRTIDNTKENRENLLTTFKEVYQPLMPANNYIGDDLSEYYDVIGHHRDSDLIEESNWQSIIKELRIVYGIDVSPNTIDKDHNDGIFIARFGHWAVGWIEELMIQPEKLPNEVLKYFIEVHNSLEDYPVLDDEDFSNREYEDQIASWDNWISWDFMKLIKKTFNLYDIKEREDKSSDDIRVFFEVCMEKNGSEYITESGGTSVYNFENVLDDITLEEIKEYYTIEEMEE